MFVLEQNIPEFIQSSPYLQTLLSNGPFPEEGLEIPDGSGKQDLTVTSTAELIELLHTLRFWLVPEVAEQSSDLVRFAFLPASQTDFAEVAAEFHNDIPLVDELWQIVNSEDATKLEIAAKYGRLCVLQFLCEMVRLEPTSQAACVAAGEGHLDCLTYLHSRGATLNFNTIKAAACSGHFECVKYIVDSSPFSTIEDAAHGYQLECVMTIVDSCPDAAHYFKQLAYQQAAEHGYLACVKQMLAEWGESYSAAAITGAAIGNHVEILTLVTDSKRRIKSEVVELEESVQDAMSFSAVMGHLECLEHLHSLGYERDADLMCDASTAGILNCLKFLHEHNYPGSECVCYAAAEYGHLECLKYVHEQGMPWDEYTCLVAAERGHLECLRYAHEHGCPWWDGPAVEDLPVNSRNMHCTNRIKVAIDIDFGNGGEPGELIAASACRASTIDCLLYVLEQGASLSPACASNNAGSGSLSILQFLHARGFTWEASDCKTAAQCDSLKCLRFLHEIGTPWDARTFTATVGECYKYAVAHGCPKAEQNTKFLNRA